MAATAGAGASVSSGASYQARVGAYLLATSICGVDSEIAKGRTILSLAFETSESVDDLNVTFVGGSATYIQAKAKIDFSISEDGELRSVLGQFERQHRAQGNAGAEYYLITSGRSSRKIIYDMRAALEAFRLGSEQHFRRDQPRALVEIIDELLGVLRDIQVRSGGSPDDDAARVILRKAFVLCLDVESGDAMEQGLILLLQSQDFAAPTALWGKIVADCVSHAKSRHTIDAEKAGAIYDRFRVKAGQLPEEGDDDLLRIEFRKMNIAVGREVVFCRFSAFEEAPSRLFIMELYRFDENCGERTEFSDNTCKFLNGMEATLIRRAATYEGLMRLIDADPTLVAENDVTIAPINSDENYELGLCAETHRERLKQVALANPHPRHCIHCDRPVSSNSASVVESGRGDTLMVGLCHAPCLAPDDRVLGTIRSQFFEKHPELINFNPNAWFRASHNGQIALANAQSVRNRQPFLVWGGRRLRGPAGPFVVEILFGGGGREFVTSRNAIDRFSKAYAEEFVSRLNKRIQEQKESDPLCYTEQTKAFGPRSILVEQLGGKERLLVIESARVRPYEHRFAARYTRPGTWYAPLLFLRDISTGEAFSLLGAVVLLTAPLSLANYLDNWRHAGVSILNYETVSLLTDRDFDDFMLRLDDNGRTAIVDPMSDVRTPTRLISGIPIQSVEGMTAAA